MKRETQERPNGKSLSETIQRWPLIELYTLAVMLIGSLGVLTACQTTGSAVTRAPASDACLVFTPIYWSKADTLETQKQATAHNAAWKSLCGAKP